MIGGAVPGRNSPSTGRGSSGLGFSREVFVVFFPLFYLFFSGLVFDPLDFPDASGQFFTVAVDLIEIIIGQLAPLLLDRAFYLLPFAFKNVFVHRFSPLVVATELPTPSR